MKKLIVLFLLVSAGFTASAQFKLDGDTIDTNVPASPTDIVDIYNYCTNKGPNPITVKWRITDTVKQSCWEYTGFCDKNNCYAIQLNVTRGFQLKKDSSSILKLDIKSNCCIGSGSVKGIIWDAADSAGTVRPFTYTITVTASTACATGIDNVSEAISKLNLFPNPAQSILHLEIDLKQNATTSVAIINLLGETVGEAYESYMNSGTHTVRIPIGGLANGLYIARVTTNGVVNNLPFNIDK